MLLSRVCSQYSITPPFQVFFSVAPLSRMMSPVNFLESRTVHVSVNLRRRDIRMAEHRLHRAKIGASFEKMGSKRMAQSVRRYSLFDAGRQSVTANELPEPLPRQRPARAVDKYKGAGPTLGQSQSCALNIVEQLLPGPLPERNGSHLRAFAFHGQIISLKVDLLHLQSDQFRNPQPRGIQQFEHRLITDAKRFLEVGLSQQFSNIRRRKGSAATFSRRPPGGIAAPDSR